MSPSLIVLKNYFLKENIFLSLTLFFLPLSVGLSSVMLVLSLVYSIGATKVNFKILNKFQKNYLLLSVLFFLIILFNSLITNGHQLLFKYLPIMFIPVLGMPIKYKEWVVTNYFKYLIFGILLAIFIAGVRYYFLYEDTFNYEVLESILKVHPTYFAIFLLVCINHLLFGKNITNKKNIVLLFIFVLLVIFIRSRIALISLVLTGFFYFLNSFRKNKMLLGFVFFIAVLTTTFLVSGTIKGKSTFNMALAERFQIWESASDVVSKKPFFGYGIDKEFKELGIDYLYKGKLNLLDERFNSHNTFFSSLIQIGLFGSILGIIVFVFPIKLSPIYLEYISYLAIVGVCGLTESFIHRHWGIIIILITGVYAGKMGVLCNN